MKWQWKSGKIVLSASFVMFLFTNYHSALAAVSVANQTGTITITSLSGEVTTVEAGQALPSIASGSTIEVVTGIAEVTASEGDSVNVLINGATAVVQGGAQVRVVVDLSTGNANLEVVSGSVQLTQPDGTVQTVGTGETLPIAAPAPISMSSVDTPGVDPASNTGRQEDAEAGLVKGY